MAVDEEVEDAAPRTPDDGVLRVRVPGRGDLTVPDMSESVGHRTRLHEFRCLLPTQFLEEVRMQISFTSRWAFSMFVMLIFIFALSSGLLFGEIVDRIDPVDLHFMVHMSILMFSFILGLAALSETFSTSHRFLMADLDRHPVHPRVARTVLLLREALFALTFLFLPLILGIVLSLPFSGRDPGAALVHIVGLFLTFMLGLSLSFAVMALVTGPWTRVAVCLSPLLAVFAAVPLTGPFDMLLPGFRISEVWVLRHTFEWHLLVPALFLPVVLSFPGILYMGSLVTSAGRHKNRLRALTERFDMRPPYRYLVPLEYVQLRRSRGLQKIVGSYLFPLIIMSIMMLYIRLAIGPIIQAGVSFYVPLVGLISTTIYSWENNIDDPHYLSLLPVSMSDVIRSKLILFYLLAGIFSTAYIIAMTIVLGSDPAEIAFAVPAAFLLSAYTGTVTAYLTGIDPNRSLFDPVVLMKFFAMTSAPLIVLLLASQSRAASGLPLAGTIGVLAGLTVLLWRRLDRRWLYHPFV